jgi:acetylglutamate kinase
VSAVRPRPCVVKVGGELVRDAREREVLAHAIAALVLEGTDVVVVHGGGPQATALQKQLGIEPRLVGGRRITDAATLDVMKRAVGGEVNIDLTTAMVASGIRAVGLCGTSAGLVRARRRPPVVVTGGGPEPIDMGFVGDVVDVRTPLFTLLLDAGYVPVVACLAGDGEGNVFNINADVVALSIARALCAEALLLLTSTPGVLRDVRDPGSRIPRLTRDEARRAIADGTIGGGMIPKVEESLAALGAEIGAIHILRATAAGDLRDELAAPGSKGTVLVASAQMRANQIHAEQSALSDFATIVGPRADFSK